ncbi:MAG: AAA family ATPase [Pseudomonadota bacterium]|nr:AAA family ATPase [Pseudomonadota bacterium]
MTELANVYLFGSRRTRVGTTSICLATAWNRARRGRRVLVVDLHPQGHASICLLKPEGYRLVGKDATIADFWTEDDATLEERCLETVHADIDVLVGGPGVVQGFDARTMAMVQRPELRPPAVRWRRSLADLAARYDDVLIDTPPGWPPLVRSFRGIIDRIVIPWVPDALWDSDLGAGKAGAPLARRVQHVVNRFSGSEEHSGSLQRIREMVATGSKRVEFLPNLLIVPRVPCEEEMVPTAWRNPTFRKHLATLLD